MSLLNWGGGKLVVCRRGLGDRNLIPRSTSQYPRLILWTDHCNRIIPDSPLSTQRSPKNTAKRTAPHISSDRDDNHLCLNSNEQSEDAVVSQSVMLELASNSLSPRKKKGLIISRTEKKEPHQT